MSNHKIRMQLSGSPLQNEKVLLRSFAKQLKGLQSILDKIDYALTGKEHGTVSYTIDDLSLNSPLNVTLGSLPLNPELDNREEIESLFFSGLDGIISDASVPDIFDISILEAIKEFTSPIGKGLSEIKFYRNGSEVGINRPLKDKIDKILGADDWITGEMSGMLEAVNIHDNKNTCAVYPQVGPKKINGVFSGTDLLKIKDGIGKHVSVYGQLVFKERENYPHEIRIETIEIHPDDDELPTLTSLIGAAPDATGDLSTEDFIRKIRNAWG